MGDLSANQGEFGFAFNDADFSDRVLRIEIIADSSDSLSDSDGSECLPNRKRRRQISDEEIGDDAGNSSDPESSSFVQVKTFHISSPILAAKSPFFYKLFKNGMRESQHRNVTLRINASEEEASMDLLNFMYGNTMSATTITALLDVLMVADKFWVTSCVSYCSERLQKIPMSLESAIQYLELPSSVLMGVPSVRFTDFTKSQEEAMALPLSVVEVVLGSDGLEVDTEGCVFEFILKWARAHYPRLEERREILTKRLAQFICFPYMSCDNIVMKALLFKIKASYGKHILDATNFRSFERVYKYRLIKVVKFESPRPRCVVYFDLKKEDCVGHLFQTGSIFSQIFRLREQWFYLAARCPTDQPFFHFGLYLCMHEEEFGDLYNRLRVCGDEEAIGEVRKHAQGHQLYFNTRQIEQCGDSGPVWDPVG